VRAFHLAHNYDLLGQPGGVDLAPYDVIVANPAALWAHRRRATVLRDDQLVLASFDAQAPSMAGSDYYARLRAAVPCAGMLWDFRKAEAGRLLALWIDANLRDEWGGVYLDMLTAELPAWRHGLAPAAELESLIAAWPDFRGELVDELRRRGRVALGNTAGWISPELSGVCIEAKSLSALTLARFVVQWAISRPPRVNVNWYGAGLGPFAAAGEVRDGA